MKRVQKSIEYSYCDRSFNYITEDRTIVGTYIGPSATPDDERWVIQWGDVRHDYPLLTLESPEELTVLP
jgi:hypothetical protein